MDIRRYLTEGWSTEYNCWTLIRDVYINEFGIPLPDVPVDADNIKAVARELQGSPLRDLFVKIDQPVNGCIAEMGYANRALHVGIYFDGKILHNYYKGGVVFEADPPIPVIAYYAARDIST